MKKLLLIILFLVLSSNIYANGKILKSGFITKSASVKKGMDVKDPKNKIIIIYNHGQNTNDRALKGECIWVNQIRNQASLVDEEINGKKIMVYNFCSNDFAGDMSIKKSWWKSKTPYVGKHKLDKRVEKNLELVEKFIDLGVPRKQIFISGHSCGGWATLRLTAKYMTEVGGGISLMPACFWNLSKKYKVQKVGYEKAMEKFHKKYPGMAGWRQDQIDIIIEGNAPILIFTHPMDPYEGLTSDWMDDVPNFKRVVVSEKKKINGKNCKIAGSNWEEPLNEGHIINKADCFMYYHTLIKEYIASRMK